MENLLYDIINYVHLLEFDYGLQASFGFSDFPAKHKEILLPHILHDNAYCTCVKKCNFRKCISCRKAVLHKNPHEPFFGKCYAGVEEYVFPVILNGKAINIVSVSGYRTQGTTPPKFDKIDVEGKIIPQTLESAYYSLNTSIPDLSTITTAVQPLVYMVKLYMMLECTEIKKIETKKYPIAYTTALDYIAENYKNNISIEDVASYCHFSVSRLSHIFKQYAGISITQYLIKMKMIKAVNLLLYTTANISNIAAELGYNDPNYFTLQFKKYYGMSPKTYREIKETPTR
ncbi:MAG TPA: hypothetical protein DDY82_03575 [Clostridiales bacterium]|nr:hypothetical protein [Clostridiales bacterium]HBJ98129.1 hypothetical protein [Clostridiales bacterium]